MVGCVIASRMDYAQGPFHGEGNTAQTLGQSALLTRDLPTLPNLILQCLDHERKISERTASHRRDCETVLVKPSGFWRSCAYSLIVACILVGISVFMVVCVNSSSSCFVSCWRGDRGGIHHNHGHGDYRGALRDKLREVFCK